MLHYSIYNTTENKQWVTFIHGAGGSSSIWSPQVKDFSKIYNVLLIDLRGHGKSKNKLKKLKKYTFEAISNDVLEVLDYLKIKRTHFVGISLGTIIIREIAERFPKRIESMILGGAVMKMNLRGQLLMRTGRLLKSIIPYLILYRFFAYIIMPKRNHRKSRNLFINEAQKLYQKEFKKWFALVSQINPILALFRIKDTGIPTIYIMGKEDYMFLPSITRLVSKHSSSSLEVIPNCGHVVNIEKAKKFNAISINFLNSQKKGES